MGRPVPVGSKVGQRSGPLTLTPPTPIWGKKTGVIPNGNIYALKRAGSIAAGRWY